MYPETTAFPVPTIGAADYLGPATVNTSRINNDSIGAAVVMETGLVQDRMNSIIQFNINNSGGGASPNVKVRIGSKAALPDTFARYGIPAGASDDNVISDQNGVGCLAIQGFSDIVCSKAVIISEIKIFSQNVSQLNQPLNYRSLQLDGTVDEIKRNISWTQEKDDQRENMVRMKGTFVLDVQQFLEFNALQGQVFDILFKITGFNSAVIFKPVVD